MYLVLSKPRLRPRGVISVAHTKSMLDVAKRELDEVRAQLVDLEPIHDNQSSLTTVTISAAT